MEKLIIALGSNLGDPLNNLQKAVYELELAFGKCKSKSSAYKTKALYHPDNNQSAQNDYLNAVLIFESNLEASKIHEITKNIEIKLGRILNPNTLWGPRMIDIDIIMYGNQVIKTKELEIPHSQYLKRDFVLVPLLEIEAESIDPTSKNSLKSILLKLEQNFIYGDKIKL